MHILSELTQKISTALGAMDVPPSLRNEDSIQLEQPANPTHGDWSTNIALTLHGRARKAEDEKSAALLSSFPNPRSLAEALVTELQSMFSDDDRVAAVEVAGPGFINFRIADSYLIQGLVTQHAKPLDQMYSATQSEDIVIEFTDPNPFKQLHIGHLYSNTIGESIARLLEFQGHTVRRADYFGDVGMHVAKSIWGMDTLLREQNDDDPLEEFMKLAEQPLAERVSFLGNAYATGATAFKEDEAASAEITRLNAYIYKVSQDILKEQDSEAVVHADYDSFVTDEVREEWDYEYLKQLYSQGKAWSLASFESVYERLGMSFDNYYPESRAGEYGIKTVREGVATGIFEESDGAIVYPGDKFDLHTRVFINSLGLPTYECKELGLAPVKALDGHYDRSLIITGNEIDEYFKVLLHAMKRVVPELGEKTQHLSHGMVVLPSGKMSSRTGDVITATELLDESKRRIAAVIEGRDDDQAVLSREKTAEAVGQAAIKYAFLKPAVGGDIVFEFDHALSFQGNSGPYLQYTHVRTQSILEQAVETESIASSSDTIEPIDIFISLSIDKKIDLEPAERDLLSNLLMYSSELDRAATEYAPHILCSYLYDLAQSFNTFYGKHQVLKAKTEERRQLRIALVLATGQVLEHGLELLGIETVERM